MDCAKTGKLLLRLRTELGMTQRQVADIMNISDKTVSKWERGLGCPDVSLLPELSRVFGVNIEKVLSGELSPNSAEGGNMKKLVFYVCPECSSVTAASGRSEISCCGRRLEALKAKPADDAHRLSVSTLEDDFYITFDHEMSKGHFISFAAYVTYDRALIIRLYPEQGSELRFPKMHGGKLYFHCSRHGLYVN